MLKRISDKEIISIVDKCKELPLSNAQDYIPAQDAAQAQLEADIKATENMVEITPKQARHILDRSKTCSNIIYQSELQMHSVESFLAKLKPISER